MKTLPYKFLLVLPDLENRYRWHRFYESRQARGATFGTLIKGPEKTIRIDIGYGFFKADEDHWTNQEFREAMKKAFKKAKVSQLSPGCTIVMVWSNSMYWLNDRAVRESMESWNGNADESESVWRSATARPEAGE